MASAISEPEPTSLRTNPPQARAREIAVLERKSVRSLRGAERRSIFAAASPGQGGPSIVRSPLFTTDFFWPSCYIQFRLGRPMYVSNVLKCRARTLSRFFLLV